jgi:glycosyltransferase involved in cell wall biosynthesis
MIDRPLRFCMITTFYPPYNFGGDGIFVHRLSNELARRGHYVDVIHCIDAYRISTGREPTKAYEDHPNVTVHGLKSSAGFLSPLVTQQTGVPFFKAARIREILVKGFDVIHYHNISLIGGPKILEYGQGIKLYTMHEYWLVCPTHVLFKYNRTACTKRRCFVCGLSYKRPPQWWRHFGLLEEQAKHVDVFIAPSYFCKEIHQGMGFNVPIASIPNFVPPVALAPLHTTNVVGDTSEKPYFLFVGRLEKLKGLQTLIPVFKRYRKAELWIAGTGDYERQLKDLAAGDANIRFLGHIPEHQLHALYRRAVALIVPSICFETFSLVVIEAFNQQTPAIVRNIGAMPEIIGESRGGFCYNTEQDLVGAMDKLLEDPRLRYELGLKGYNAYREKWTPDAHLKRYFELIEKIAARLAGSSVPAGKYLDTFQQADLC